MKNLQSDIAYLYKDSADLSDTVGIFSQLLQRIEEIEDKLKVKPMQESHLITPLMEDQMHNDWCPYVGNPDPRVVWAAAVDACNAVWLKVEVERG